MSKGSDKGTISQIRKQLASQKDRYLFSQTHKQNFSQHSFIYARRQLPSFPFFSFLSFPSFLFFISALSISVRSDCISSQPLVSPLLSPLSSIDISDWFTREGVFPDFTVFPSDHVFSQSSWIFHQHSVQLWIFNPVLEVPLSSQRNNALQCYPTMSFPDVTFTFTLGVFKELQTSRRNMDRFCVNLKTSDATIIQEYLEWT